jgi:hypothetical protein
MTPPLHTAPPRYRESVPAAVLNGRYNAGYRDLFWHQSGWHAISQVTVPDRAGSVIRLYYGRPQQHLDLPPSETILCKLAHQPG